MGKGKKKTLKDHTRWLHKDLCRMAMAGIKPVRSSVLTWYNFIQSILVDFFCCKTFSILILNLGILVHTTWCLHSFEGYILMKSFDVTYFWKLWFVNILVHVTVTRSSRHMRAATAVLVNVIDARVRIWCVIFLSPVWEIGIV